MIMRSFRILFCFAILLNAGCKKLDNSKEHPFITTTAEGYVYTRYTHKAVGGATIILQGYKPYESQSLCLFCPDSTVFEIASTTTDSNGHYYIEGTTNEPVSSTIIWHETGYGQYLAKGEKTTALNFANVEYIILKEHFHLINNNKPPFYFNPPISCCIPPVYAADTFFTAFGKSLDTSVQTFNHYSYKDNGVEHSKSEFFQIGAFKDTLEFNFTVDASTF